MKTYRTIITAFTLIITTHLFYGMDIERQEKHAAYLSDSVVLKLMQDHLKNKLVIHPHIHWAKRSNGKIVDKGETKINDHGYIYKKPESVCIQFLTCVYEYENADLRLGLFLKHSIKDRENIETNYYLTNRWDSHEVNKLRKEMGRFWSDIPEQLIDANPEHQWYTVRKS